MLKIGIPQIGMRAGTLYQRLEFDARQAALRNGASLWYAGGKNDLAGFIFQDSTGTTAATGTDPVGLILDRSRVAGESYGAELVASQTWTTGSANTSISSGNTVVFAGAGNGAIGQASIPVALGKTYKVIIVVSGLSAGLVGVDLGGASAYANISANGTYTQLITCAGGAGVVYAVAKQTTTTASVQVTSVQEAVGNLGPELVTNGNFSDDSTGYFLGPGWSISAEQASHTGTAGNMRQSSILTLGKYYKLTVDVTTQSSGFFRLYAGSGTGYLWPFGTSPGTRTIILQCSTDTSLYIQSDGTCTIDNVSVRELLGYSAFQTTAANKPTLELQANGYYGMRFDGGNDRLDFDGTRIVASNYTVGASALFGSTITNGVIGGTAVSLNQNTVLGRNAAGNPILAQIGNDLTGPSVISWVPKRVLTGKLTSSGKRLYVDGVLTQSDAVATQLTSFAGAGLAGYSSGIFAGLIFCAWVAPADMPDADRIAIERFAALLSGAAYV